MQCLELNTSVEFWQNDMEICGGDIYRMPSFDFLKVNRVSEGFITTDIAPDVILVIAVVVVSGKEVCYHIF